uniref:Uncharacterized protein n=1 Tax=Arundo donax TaxID=35708 RepID=A0A0A9HRG0_ARUDO
MTAPACRKRVKRLVRLKLPVTHLPGGTSSLAPPSPPAALALSCSAATARRNAAVLDVAPSPTAPNSSTDAVTARIGPAPV